MCIRWPDPANVIKRHQNYFVALFSFVRVIFYKISSTQPQLEFSKLTDTIDLHFSAWHLLLPISNYQMSFITIRFLVDQIEFIITESFKVYKFVYPPESTDLQTVHMIDEIVIQSTDFYQYVSELCGKLFLSEMVLLKKTITIKFEKIVDIIVVW